MFERLKQLAARLAGRLPPLPPLPGPPEDPSAGVREPRRRGPAGRNSAAAVMEPPPDEIVGAVARLGGDGARSANDQTMF
jgi:hypothetical protein